MTKGNSNTLLERRFADKLTTRLDAGLLRRLRVVEGRVDLSSNDYLGIARIPIKTAPQLPRGSTGSRLLSGNSLQFAELERFIADFHQVEASLVFNSGYSANLSLLSCLPERHDFILYDRLVHASIIDGIRLSCARSRSFKHNDLQDLERLISRVEADCIFVVVESVYSMDGDLAPLGQMVELCEKYGCHLIVDEAHSVGLFGQAGRGLLSELGISDFPVATIVTYGKAFGCHGAAILGSQRLSDYLCNFARPFIYTTALSPEALYSIRDSYSLIEDSDSRRLKLTEVIDTYRQLFESANRSPIQSYLVSGNQAAKELERICFEAGIDVRAILSPTVPKGEERLRISLHSFNTEDQIRSLRAIISNQAQISEDGMP